MHTAFVFEPHPAALTALCCLTEKGHEAYLVGGCVRDAYVGRVPGDYDIATSALPQQAKEALASYPTLDTGLAHGTITALVEGLPIEITTYRVDGVYTDGRHPDQVSFTRNITEDLARRDFTCNAMAWNPEQGLVDPFFGRQDCDLRLIRAVGDAKERFSEDALRILRALRFCCQLGFVMEDSTLAAIFETAPGLARVARERVAAEINKSLLGKYACEALRQYPRVLFLALPELAPMLHTPQRTPFHIYDVWEHSLLTLQQTPIDLALRWAALYHDSGKPQTLTLDRDGTTHFRGHQGVSERLLVKTMERLKQPKALAQQTALLVRHHDDRVALDNLKLWINRLGFDTTLKLLRLIRADLATHAPETAKRVTQVDALFEEAMRLQESGACLTLSCLAVKGEDLLALGFPRDKQLGQAMDRLLKAVLTDALPNEKAALLSLAQEILNQQ